MQHIRRVIHTLSVIFGWIWLTIKAVAFVFISIVGFFFSYYMVLDWGLPAVGFYTTAQRNSHIIKYDFMKDGQFYVYAGSLYNVGYEIDRSNRISPEHACDLNVHRKLLRINGDGKGDQEWDTQTVDQNVLYSSNGFQPSNYAVPAPVSKDMPNGTYKAFSVVQYFCDFFDRQVWNRINQMDPDSSAIIHVVCGQKNKTPVPEDDFTDCPILPSPRFPEDSKR